jgi:hypothetical protein
MTESLRAAKAEDDHGRLLERKKPGFQALIKSFFLGDDSSEGDDATGGDNRHKDHHDKDEQQHHSRHSSSSVAVGHRKEAGLHGGPSVFWYHNLFPLNQKFEPRVEYPLWDDDW